MKLPKVSCICATRGRFASLCESVSFFILQDYPNKELIILNNHPVDIEPHPDLVKHNIKVINVGDRSGYSMNRIYNEILNYISDDSELVSIWDDDDAYFPWFLSDNINKLINSSKRGIRSRAVYWQDDINNNYITIESNVLESSMIIYRDNIFYSDVQHSDTDIHFGCPHLPWVASLQENEKFLYNNDITLMFRWNYEHMYHHLQSVGPHKNIEDSGKDQLLKPVKIDHVFKKIPGNIKQTLKEGIPSTIDNEERAALFLQFLNSNIELFN